jgi:hypothetical protein
MFSHVDCMYDITTSPGDTSTIAKCCRQSKETRETSPCLLIVVAHTGFEPVISALRGRCPEPLDECAMCCPDDNVMKWVMVVAHTGFEPVISALRGRCPEPLDECAIDLTGYIIANSSLFVNSEKGVFRGNTCGQSRRGREGQNGNYGVLILASFCCSTQAICADRRGIALPCGKS